MKKSIFIASILLISAFHIPSVLAVGCRAMTTGSGVEGNKLNYQLSSPLVTIDPNAPTGSILWTRNIDTSGIKWVCNSGAQRPYRSAMGAAYSTIVGSNSRGNIYSTGVEGLGIQISDLYQPNKGIPNLAYPTAVETQSWSSHSYTRIDFIKVGPIGSGDLKNGQLATFTMDGVMVMNISMLGSRLKNKSCTLDGGYNRTIPLGKYKTSDINPSSPKTSFELKLTCQADAVPVYIQFDPLNGSSGDGLLNIDSNIEQPASGVVVEVLNQDNSPLKFGIEEKYHMNQESSVSIPLKAGIKKAGMIKGGKVSAGMTITINER